MTRITLVLNGSASLGAYTAGAAVELLTALEDDRQAGRAVVDVVTGSSAGALTAAMAARSLVVNPNLVPWIERTWIEAMDAQQLLNPSRADRSGWLDPDPVDELTAHLVSGPAASDDRPSEALGDELRVGLSLQPLGEAGGPGRHDGSVREGGRRADATYRLGRDSGPGLPVWTELRRAAVAATSIPVAFPPRPLALRSPGRRTPGGGEREPLTGWYVGDGLGAERPVTLARRLAAASPAGGDRRVVVVDPTSADPGGGAGPAGGPDTSADALGRALAGLLGGGAAEDLEDAADAARRTRVLGALADRLPEIHGRLEDPNAVALGRRVGELAERVAEDAVARDAEGSASGGGSDPVLDWLDRHLSRIQAEPRYGSAFESTTSRAGRTRLAKLILVLEAIGGLAEAPVADLLPVRPPADEELAGRALGGFGGFLERDWRAHDLRAGRRDARRLLEGPLSDVVDYAPRDDADYEPGRVDARLEALRPGARDRLGAFLRAEAARLLEDLRPGGLAGLLYGGVRPALSRALADRMLAELRRL